MCSTYIYTAHLQIVRLYFTQFVYLYFNLRSENFDSNVFFYESNSCELLQHI